MLPSIFDEFDRAFSVGLNNELTNYFLDEDSKYMYLQIDLPGISKNEVKVELNQNRLIVKAEVKVKNKMRSYHKIFTLPKLAKLEAVEADLKDGVLLITIPKVESALPRLIEVK